MPRVSVVVPVYNSAATLDRAIGSVLTQTLPDLELLIVDDGSTDGSGALARRLVGCDRRARVITLPENRGKPHAMNRAIAEAEGEWIAVLDADDWYESDRLSVLLAAGLASAVPLVADNQTFHDAGANAAIATAFAATHDDIALDRAAFIAGCDPFAPFDFGMLKPMARADFIRRHGLAYREAARLSEDFLWLVEFFAAGGTGVLLSRPLYNWTQPFGGVSRQWTTTGAGAWRYDYASAIAPLDNARRELLDRNEHALAALLAARIRAYRRLHELSEIHRARADGAPIARLLSKVARHPAIWPGLARGAWRAIRRGELAARLHN